MGLLLTATHFSQHLYHHWSARQSLSLRYFSHPLLILLGGLLDEAEAGQLALRLWPTHQQWEHCQRWWKSCSENHYECLPHLKLLLLHLLGLQLVPPSCWLLRELQIHVRSGWNSLVTTPWAWASFTLDILNFSSNINDESLCTEVPLIRLHWLQRFTVLRLFENRSQLRSC